MAYIYRGVHAAHPALADAKNGIVRPADSNGKVTPAQHNEGGFSGISPFTSWTHDLNRATWYANRSGPGGVLLRVSPGKASKGEDWSWVLSEDRWIEDEVLLRSVRLNIEVIAL